MSGSLDLLLDMAPMTVTGAAMPCPNAMSWGNIAGIFVARTTQQTVAGISGASSAPITATNSGSGTLYSVINGGSAGGPYAGAFNVANGQTLGWMVANQGSGTVSGMVTVKSGSTVLGSFNYVIWNLS